MLQCKINWLLAALIVDQPKPSLTAIPDLVIKYFPIKNKGTPPGNASPHHAARQGILLLRRIMVGGEPEFADKHTLSCNAVFRLELRLEVIERKRQLPLRIGSQRVVGGVGNVIDTGRRQDDAGSARLACHRLR